MDRSSPFRYRFSSGLYQHRGPGGEDIKNRILWRDCKFIQSHFGKDSLFPFVWPLCFELSALCPPLYGFTSTSFNLVSFLQSRRLPQRSGRVTILKEMKTYILSLYTFRNRFPALVETRKKEPKSINELWLEQASSRLCSKAFAVNTTFKTASKSISLIETT